PGGGSAAALAGALAAALGQMVANLTVGRKKYAKVEGDIRAALERLERAAGRLGSLAVDDSAAFDELMKAHKAGGDDETAKQAGVQRATVHAAAVPLEVADTCAELMEDLALLAAQGNPNARTDAQVGAYLAHAAVMGACLNIAVNVEGIADEAERQRFGDAVARLRREAAERLARIVGA
ncbi:MAG TPA: cyclodeaminase/cyclohydrolase family protein, partial [Herpetosiphonaceae bacterium]